MGGKQARWKAGHTLQYRGWKEQEEGTCELATAGGSHVRDRRRNRPCSVPGGEEGGTEAQASITRLELCPDPDRPLELGQVA